MNTAASIVREARLKRRLSMNWLALLVGVPASTISRIESGKIEPTFNLVSKITDALGFSLGTEIDESGSDAPFERFLESLPPDCDYKDYVSKFENIAQLAPVAKRLGSKKFEITTSLQSVVDALTKDGQSPIVSSLEAFNSSIEPASSFIPIIYVDQPSSVDGLPAAAKAAKQVAFLLQTTSAVKAQSRIVNSTTMTTPAWGILDALASPGRQPDAALELIGKKSIIAA